MQPNNRFIRAASWLGTFLDRIGYIWMWIVISLMLLSAVALINPVLVGSYVWVGAKLTLAAVIGYTVDFTLFPGGNPRYLDGIEKSMAQTRRVTLIAAAMIAAGLIG